MKTHPLQTAYGRLNKALIYNNEPTILQNCKNEAINTYKFYTGISLIRCTAREVLKHLENELEKTK